MSKTEMQIIADNLQKAETYYQHLQEHLEETGQLLDKHRKTANAAKSEATATNEEWKQALRATGGNISKSVRELKRKEIAARETAEEFTTLVDELEPKFHDLQIVTSQARQAYVTAFERMQRANTTGRLEATADKIFSTEQGQEFLSLLLHLATEIRYDCAKDQGLQEMVRAAPAALGLPVDEAEAQMTNQRVHAFVFKFIERYGNKIENSTICIKHSPMAAGRYELPHTQASPRESALAAARLKGFGILTL